MKTILYIILFGVSTISFAQITLIPDSNFEQASVDVLNLSSGIYFLDIEDGNANTEVKKFIKN
ncbi:MAG: T9SS type A sorting domain-containing protein [Aequorivita sp.]